MFYFGLAPGDDLLCTVVLREMKKRGCRKPWMMSNYPELFRDNDDVAQVVPCDPRFEKYGHILGAKWHILEYAKIDVERDMSLMPQRHILTELCARAGIEGDVVLRPYLNLTEAEMTSGKWAQGMITIQSSGLAGIMPMRNKQWFPERFQRVIDCLKNDFKFVQIGSSDDPPLVDVIDLRGKTRIRETAAVLANCRLYLGNIGFLMHLARAVECPSVIVYGGREAPGQSGYSCNRNLYSAVPCAPCGLLNKCDYDRICMKNIIADDVIDAVEQMIKRPRHPLVEDTAKV